MNFRIFRVKGQQVLLERIEDDEQWRVFICVYLDLTTRYDEWIACENATEAKYFISMFSRSRVLEFLDRADAWWLKQEAQLTGIATA